jgi:hypothetical protein
VKTTSPAITNAPVVGFRTRIAHWFRKRLGIWIGILLGLAIGFGVLLLLKPTGERFFVWLVKLFFYFLNWLLQNQPFSIG